MKIKLRSGEEISAKSIDDLRRKLKVMYEGRAGRLDRLNKERIELTRAVKELERLLKGLGEEVVKKESADVVKSEENKDVAGSG